MALTIDKKEEISIEVIKTLYSLSERLPEDVINGENAPFREAFLNASPYRLDNRSHATSAPFFINLSSLLYGLNASFGQKFFEKIAHILCYGEKREYTSKGLGNLEITEIQQGTVMQIMKRLVNSGEPVVNLQEENEKLLKEDDSPKVNADDFTADVFYEDSDSVVAIRLMVAKSGYYNMCDEKQKILEGKAALFHLFPNKKIHFFFGFPFDPTVDTAVESATSYDKIRFLKSIVNAEKYCAIDEFLIASELWDFLSGTSNTMETIIEIINTIATPDFQTKIDLLKDKSNRTTVEYMSQLTEWYLVSEKELIINDVAIQKLLTDTRIERIYNKITFDKKGEYNWDRYNTLKKLL